MLVLRARQAVPTDVLIDALWDDAPPATAAKSLQVYVSRLRKALGEHVIATRPPGYVLQVEPEQLDAERFERLVEEARHEPPERAAATLRDAIGLWRGPPLSDFAYEAFAASEIARLEELRLTAVEARIDADLALGRHARLVSELHALVDRHPLRERLCSQLMLALYRCGRQAEALDVYRETRRRLSDELGLEPGQELRDLERRIFAHDPSLAVSDEQPVAAAEAPRTRRRIAAAVLLSVLSVAGAAAATIALTRGGSGSIVVQPNSVAVVDARSNRVTAAVQVGDRPTTIAVRGDDVWVLHPDRRILSHLSRSGRTLLGTVGLGGAPSGLAADEEGAWVSDARTASLTLIEPERLAPVRTIETRARPLTGPYPDAGAVADGFGSLWLASGKSTISRIDARSGRILARIHGVQTGESLGGIAIGAGSVWVAGPFQESPVTRIDPGTNSVVATIQLQKFRADRIAVTEGVWVSDVGSDQIWRIDPARNVPVGAAKVGLAPLGVTAGAGAIWVANSGDGTVSRIDPLSGNVVETIAVGGSPNGIAATDDEIWVTVD